MKPTQAIKSLLLSLFVAVAAFAQPQAQAQESYPPHPDSVEQPGVPKGEVLKFTFDKSKIFPGTWREYWVYIPKQYSPDKPACVYVNQDGVQWNAPMVFDNLIHKKEMPVTIGVFVMHGKVLAKDGTTSLDRFNRSFEYDGLGDNYARFLLEELLPDVEWPPLGSWLRLLSAPRPMPMICQPEGFRLQTPDRRSQGESYHHSASARIEAPRSSQEA